jgi:hypothetical protein
LLVSLIVPGHSFGQFPTYTGCNGQQATRQLQLSITSLDASTGLAQVNGVILQPTASLSWAWGDGATTQGFFPQSHTYANKQQDYTLQVVAHETSGSSDCAQITIPFSSNTQPGLAITWSSLGPRMINGFLAGTVASGRLSALAIFYSNPAIMYVGGGRSIQDDRRWVDMGADQRRIRESYCQRTVARSSQLKPCTGGDRKRNLQKQRWWTNVAPDWRVQFNLGDRFGEKRYRRHCGLVRSTGMVPYDANRPY